jgi:general stress protein 26
MAALAPKPFTQEELPALARGVIERAKFPQLATVDGTQPRLRPVSPVRVDEDFTIYIANLRSSGKTKEIGANPQVELCYLDDNHDQVRVTGVAEVLTDAVLLREIWESNTLLRRYLGSLENPELIVYRVRPTRVRFMREWALEYHELFGSWLRAGGSKGEVRTGDARSSE